MVTNVLQSNQSVTGVNYGKITYSDTGSALTTGTVPGSPTVGTAVMNTPIHLTGNYSFSSVRVTGNRFYLPNSTFSNSNLFSLQSGSEVSPTNASMNEVADSTGTRLSASVMAVIDKGGQVYNVKAYGAVGDGITDDTASIQSAINAALAAGGGVVHIPRSTYKVLTGLSATLSGKQLVIEGDGDGTILQTAATTSSHANDIINITGGTTVGVDRIAIRNLQIIGNTTGGMGITLTNCYQGDLTNIRAKNFTAPSGWGVGINFSQSIDITVTNLVVTGCNYAGVLLGSTSNANTFVGGWIYGQVSGGAGVRVSSANKNTFLGTIIESNTDYGVIFSGGRYNELIGCWIENNGIQGVRLDETSSVVDSCWFTLNTLDIDVLSTSTDALITKNRFNDGGKVTLESGSTRSVIRDNINLTTLTNNGAVAPQIFNAGLLGVGNIPTAYIDTAASTTSNASLRLRSGVAPTTPNDGDIWYDGTNLKMRVGGTTKTFTLT